MTRVVSAKTQLEVGAAGERGLWLSADDLEALTGWRLKPEGLCQEDTCVPIDPALAERVVAGDRVDAATLWESLGRPVLHDTARTTWVLGEAAADRSRRLESLQAPDFTLPDLEGRLHSLSDQRGKKVLLATWASW